LVAQIIQRLTGALWPMVTLFLLLLAALYMLGDSAENMERFGEIYIWLLLLNGLGLLVIAVLIGANALQLVRQFRARAAGSRLTAKLVGSFVLIALVPVLIVYSFSVRYLSSGIDSWFDVRVEQALTDALDLSSDALGQQMRLLQRITLNISDELVGVSAIAAVVLMDRLSSEVGAQELTLLTPGNQVIASSAAAVDIRVVPSRPADDIAAQVRRGVPYIGLDPLGDSELVIRVVVPVLTDDPFGDNRLLQALYPVSERSGALAERVEDAFQQYRQLLYLREPLKLSYILTLSLVLLLSALMAVWVAFYSARRLMQPIHHLAEGTRAVAAGDYSTRLPAQGRDEMAFLVNSFNEMTARIAQARDAASASQIEAERQRAYLEAVLARLSTGVITLDTAGRLRTANQAAAAILGDDMLHAGARLGLPSGSVETADAAAGEQDGERGPVQQFWAVVAPHVAEAEEDWSSQFELFDGGGRKHIVCRGARLPGQPGGEAGYVLVFDDLTAVVRAQRDAAWAEVARRWAHEIKNPLTPIQLSAERLRRKYLAQMAEEDARVLDRATHTIVQQVESMKSMVKAFAEYANTPPASFAEVDVNTLVADVAELYRGGERPLRMMLDLGSDLPRVSADSSRLRQVLHNLIKNALEAQADAERPALTLRTRAVHGERGHYLELCAEDGGPGFPVDVLDRVFEPYVTSKPRGTGLGLAIVKKIVEEHGGTVRAANLEGGGGAITLSLPLGGLRRDATGDKQ